MPATPSPSKICFALCDPVTLTFDLLTYRSINWLRSTDAGLSLWQVCWLHSFSCFDFVHAERQTYTLTHTHTYRRGWTRYSCHCRRREARFPFKRNRLRCVSCVNETARNTSACVGKQPIMVATASTEHSCWLALAFVAWNNASGFHLRNARNASDCVRMETGLEW